MKIKLQSILFFLFVSALSLSGQRIDQTELLMELEIKSVTYEKLIYDSDYSDYDLTDYVRIDSINEFGKMYKSTIHHENGYSIITKKSYTDHNKVYDILKYKDSSDIPFKVEEFYYDEDGNLLKIDHFRKDNEHAKTHYFGYNNKNQIESRRVEQTSTNGVTEYNYFYKNELVDYIECIQDGKHVFSFMHKYDKHNNLIEHYKSGRKKHTIVELEYNDDNKMISKTYRKIRSILNSDEFVHLSFFDIAIGQDILSYQYSYDDESGLLIEIIEIKNDTPIAKFELFYDP